MHRKLRGWVLVGAGFGLLACAGDEDIVAPPEDLTFPADFEFGTAIAGFQVDMGCPALPASDCEDPNSDWYAFVTSPEMIMDGKNYLSGDPPSAGPGHWELFDQDFERAALELSNDTLRMSIEWSRIFPAATDGAEGYDALKMIADQKAIDHYHAVFDALAKRGLTPLVTLNHYTLPTWIHDGIGCHKDLDNCSPRGWLDKGRTVKEIAKYAGFVAQEFGAQVDRWATLNEPFALVLPGYLQPTPDRSNPPSVFLKFAECKVVMVALIEAHARMYDAVKAGDLADADGDGKASEVGLVYATAPIQPKDPKNSYDVEAAKNIFYLYNLAFLNAVVKGDLDDDLDGIAEHRDDLANRMDYLGLNYYFLTKVAGGSFAFFPELSPLTTFNPVEVETNIRYPKGLYEMAMFAKDSMGVPAFITENGVPIAQDDDGPSAFVTEHLTWLHRAIRDGADVRGYYYWSLMDNYEWNHGMGMRFGLYAVEKDDPQKLRTARKMAEVYGEIAKQKVISAELQTRFPAPE